MPSIRLDKQIFPFFDSVKTPVTATGTSDSFHNNGFSVLTLEVPSTCSGYVEGCINIIKSDGEVKTDAECSWNTLGLISLKDYSTATSFSTAGEYAIGINGMARVRVVLTSVTGSTTIVGVAEV